MDLSSDRQTARCQLCSVQPDNTAQYRLLPETNGWAARLCLQGTACVCFFCLVWLFVHFSVCPSICGLFPLLTTEINMLKYYINRTDGCTKKICTKNIVTESTSPTNHNHNVGLKKVVKEKKKAVLKSAYEIFIFTLQGVIHKISNRGLSFFCFASMNFAPSALSVRTVESKSSSAEPRAADPNITVRSGLLSVCARGMICCSRKRSFPSKSWEIRQPGWRAKCGSA